MSSINIASSNTSSSPSQFISYKRKEQLNNYLSEQGKLRFAEGSIYRRVPSFLTEAEGSTLSQSDRIAALSHRIASIEALSFREEQERQRRSGDLAGENSRKSLAARTSSLFKSGSSASALKTTARPQMKLISSLAQLEFLGAALGAGQHKAAWADFESMERTEQLRRECDVHGEALKKILARDLSLRFMSGYPTIVLRHSARRPVGYLILDEEAPVASSLEHGVEAIVDGAKSLGNLALRAASFFGFKALEGAQNIAAVAVANAPAVKEKAQIIGEAALDGALIAGEKALEGAQIAGGIAVAGAQNLGGKAIEGAQIAGEIAVAGAQNLGGKAIEGAQIAGEIAVAGAQNLGEKAIEGAQIAGAIAVDGAQRLAEKTAEGVQIAGGIAVDGAQRLTQKAANGALNLADQAIEGAQNIKEGAQNLAGQAQALAGAAADKMLDAWDNVYTLSWAGLTALEEVERAWRLDSALSLDRFMLAMNVSNLMKDYIRVNDAAFYQPRRHYGTAVLEEFERIRRLLEFRTDRSSRKNAHKTARLIRAHVKRSGNNVRYDNWTMTSAQKDQAFPAQSQISSRPASSSAPLMAMAQTQSAGIQAAPAAIPASFVQPTLAAMPAAAAFQAARTWGPSTQSRWAYVAPAQSGFLSTGSYKQVSSWKPTPAAQLLQQGAQQQQFAQTQQFQQTSQVQQGFQQAQQGLQFAQQGLQQAQAFAPKQQVTVVQQSSAYTPAM